MASSTRQPGQTTNAVHWRQLRAERIEQTDGRCENCGRQRPGQDLHFHHLTYERIGAELPRDALLLCSSCHRSTHATQPELVRPAPPSLPVGRRKDRTGSIVRLIRLATVCERCGDSDKRIEWHHDEHPQHPERRISNLVDDGKPIEAVIAEIERCEAVCRKCHINGDHRLAIIRQNVHSRGERNGRAKLTAAHAAEIRRAYAADSKRGAVTAIAKRYGVSRPTICHVLAGRTWRE